MNLSILLTMAAETMPDRVAVTCDGREATYGELLQRSRQVASHLRRASVDHLAAVITNSEMLPPLLFGSALAGQAFVPLSYRLPDDRLRRLVTALAPAIVVCDESAVVRLGCPRVDVVSIGAFFDSLAAPESPADVPANGDDLAVILYTSGTSGDQKQALLRHRHLVSYVISTVDFMSAGETDATLIAVPPYHIAGISAVMTSVYAGRRMVYLPTFDPAEWVATARRQRVTHATLVPTMLARIIDLLRDSGDQLPHLRHVAYGGGRMPMSVISEAMGLLPSVDFVNAYGLTETSSTITLLGPDDHRDAVAAEDEGTRRRLGSVGRPIPGVELEIRDESGLPVAGGVLGTVWVRGAQVSGEYAGSEARRDGWFDTKDAGYVDADGFLFLAGRGDDVIVRGGENLAPGDIENALVSHPQVLDAAVVAAPDRQWGEVPVAAVVAREPPPSEDALKEWVRAQLRSARTPERVVFVSELPYTETGKLLRRTVREWLGPAPD